MKNEYNIKIYIKPSKPYYYTGTIFSSNILLDILEKVKCDQMLIIAKGKLIVKAIQKESLDSYIDSDSDPNEYDVYDSDEDEIKQKKKINKNSRNEDNSSEEKKNKKLGSFARNLDETIEIFKYKKVVQISKNKYINQGKYCFPFELKLPEKIPGSFLFLMVWYAVEVEQEKTMLSSG